MAILDELATARDEHRNGIDRPDHDDPQNPHKWAAAIAARAYAALNRPFDLANFRRQMLAAAALATLAVEDADQHAAEIKAALEKCRQWKTPEEEAAVEAAPLPSYEHAGFQPDVREAMLDRVRAEEEALLRQAGLDPESF